MEIEIGSSNYSFFNPDYDLLEKVEGFDLEGATWYAAILFDFSFRDGLVPVKLVFLNEQGHKTDLSALSYENQTWLMGAVQKTIDLHEKIYYNRIERYFLELT